MAHKQSLKLETERLILREWKEEDREHFARMNADPLIMEYLPRLLDRKGSDKLVDRFEGHFKKHGFGLFAVELKSSGQFMGFVGLERVDFKAAFTPAVEIAWRLDYEFWGKGYATEAALQVLHFAFKDLKLEDVVSFTVHDNSRAIHVMEKIGMKKVKGADFDYPQFEKGHPLGRFVLYKITAEEFEKA